MTQQPYQSIRFDWLADAGNLEVVVKPDQGDVDKATYPLPNGLGTTTVETLNCAMGMSMFRAVNRLLPEAIGQSIPTAEIDVNLKEPTFQTQIMRGGRVMEKQLRPTGDLILSPGIDLFRYSDGYRIVPMLDGTSDSEMTCLSITRKMLNRLIGENEVEEMLNHLGLQPMPKVIASAIPLHVSSHLHASISQSLTGAAKKMHCQARALDYLTALLEHTKTAHTESAKSGTKRTQDIHDLLINAHGKLPTLNELAAQFGCSARTLNDEFSAAFGMSIYTFITNQRLLEAHAAILNTDVALKTLAFKLGYAHVNHFITAFRKKFGYPPGSLRKKLKT